jgi:dephospho-CoA kinase
MTQAKKAGKNVLVEVPLLFEAGWQDDFDKVVVVYAAEAVCLARICRRDGVSLDEAGKGLYVQMPIKEKVMAADYVIDNSGNWSDTLIQLLHLGEILEDLACCRGKNT